MLGFGFKITYTMHFWNSMILSSSDRWETYYCERVTGDVAEARRELPLCSPAGPFLVDVFQSLSQSSLKLNTGLLPNGVSKCQKMKMNERACDLRHLFDLKTTMRLRLPALWGDTHQTQRLSLTTTTPAHRHLCRHSESTHTKLYERRQCPSHPSSWHS